MEITKKRNDGLTVFIEESENPLIQKLNQVRINGSRMDVYKAVGIVRGVQIALSYAKKHGTEEEVKQLESEIKNIKLIGEIK